MTRGGVWMACHVNDHGTGQQHSGVFPSATSTPYVLLHWYCPARMLARNQDIGARHTRAPSLRNGPSYTVPATHDVAINVRTRSASRTRASSPSTMPYTVGPHELWPTPAAPHSAMWRTSS